MCVQPIFFQIAIAVMFVISLITQKVFVFQIDLHFRPLK